MKRIAIVAVILILFRCSGRGITLYAPPIFAGAALYVDGKFRGNFSATIKHYRWVGIRKLRDEISLPPRDETFIVLHNVPRGTHTLRITKTGQTDVIRQVLFDGRHEIELEGAPAGTQGR